MNYRRILNKNNIGIIFLFMIILLWPVIPHLCDFLVIINIFISFFYGGIKKDNKLIFFIFIILLISFLSFELNNIIYAIRWGVYLINCYLTLTNLDEKTVYKIMYLLQFLTLPVGLIYVKYLGSIDNYNLHLLGDMMFSGSKNHYSYYIIINYIILYYLSQRLDKKKFFITILTILQLVMARSATAMLAFIIIYFILNVINFKKFDKVMLLNVGILLSLLILFNLGTKNELINKNFNQRVERTVQRIFNIRNDESVNIRTQVLYKSFNSELETRSVEKSVLGNGSYINFENILPYDSSYYAIIMSGGILLVSVILVIVIKNILLYKNKIYFSILIANVVFFFSANVFFELQNIISIVFLICPGILFIPNKHGDK